MHRTWPQASQGARSFYANFHLCTLTRRNTAMPRLPLSAGRSKLARALPRRSAGGTSSQGTLVLPSQLGVPCEDQARPCYRGNISRHRQRCRGRASARRFTCLYYHWARPALCKEGIRQDRRSHPQQKILTLEANEFLVHDQLVGGRTSRQGGEPMPSYVDRRRRWWRLIQQPEPSIARSEPGQ